MQCKPLERALQGLHHSAPPRAAGESSSCSTSTPTLAAVGFSHPHCSGGGAARPSFPVPSSGPTRGAEALCVADEDTQLCEAKRFAHSPFHPGEGTRLSDLSPSGHPFLGRAASRNLASLGSGVGRRPILGTAAVLLEGCYGTGSRAGMGPAQLPRGGAEGGRTDRGDQWGSRRQTQRRGGESVLCSTWGRSPPCSGRPGPGWGGGGECC